MQASKNAYIFHVLVPSNFERIYFWYWLLLPWELLFYCFTENSSFHWVNYYEKTIIRMRILEDVFSSEFFCIFWKFRPWVDFEIRNFWWNRGLNCTWNEFSSKLIFWDSFPDISIFTLPILLKFRTISKNSKTFQKGIRFFRVDDFVNFCCLVNLNPLVTSLLMKNIFDLCVSTNR